MKQNIIVVAGPTATGKTKLAVSLAKCFGGEVVSADSMQIYKGMDIGSAKPTPEETEGVKHWLIDEVEPDKPFSVAEYVTRAKAYISDIAARGRLPIIAGGTGLYISSLIDNVQFTEGKTDFALRKELFALAQEQGDETLHAMLAAIDPEAAQMIHPNNRKRVVRAIEIFKTTGVTMTEQNARSKAEPSPYEPVMLALTAEREILYGRINRRVDQMAETGLIDEVRRLRSAGLTADMQSMQGIGYKEVFAYLDGSCGEKECLELVKKNSRNYAKRQLTWFRRDKRYEWFDCTNSALEEKAARYVKERLGMKDKISQ